MPERSLDQETLARIAAFEQATKVQPLDCLAAEDRLVFVVPADLVGKAVGKGGETVQRLEQRLDRRVQVVGYDDDPAAFVEAFFFDVDVRDVRMEDRGDRTVAVVEVGPRDRARAIGKGGRNVKLASELAERHHDVEVVVE